MASSDSTGFHRRSWRFHQYSSSGQVLEATSGCTLEMKDGSNLTVSTGAGVTLNSSLTLTGQISNTRLNSISATGGTLAVGRNLCTLTAATSQAHYALPIPTAVGQEVEVMLQAGTSTVWRIYSATSGVNFGSTLFSAVNGDTDAGLLSHGAHVRFVSTSLSKWRIAELRSGSTKMLSVTSALA